MRRNGPDHRIQSKKTDVEPAFGQIETTILGQTGFLVRGSEKVKGEFGLA